MKREFWLERWERQETGFHQGEVNPYLLSYWQELEGVQGGEVFVPLCGKSKDMLWLRQQGHPVIGVECSAIAVDAFFVENGYSPNQTSNERFSSSEADSIRILCGDFFDLGREDMVNVRRVYDRASLVALPTEMRARYAHHLASILPAGTQIMLITFDYPQTEMSGPPFAVPLDEVQALYRDYATLRVLATRDVLAQNPRFQQGGLSRLHENILLLTMN